MGRVTRLAAALADRVGLALVAKWRLKRLEAAEHLRQLLRRYEVDVVVDVGANEGQFRDFLRLHVGFEGWIASFEPVPEAFAVLESRASRDHRWSVSPVALGARSGTASFHVSAHSTLSSFYKPNFAESDHAARKRATVREIEVDLDTLDRQLPALLGRLGVARPYLKIDTQGSDMDVIRGAERCLGDIVGLQFEGSVIPLYEGPPPFTHVLAHLNERGFALSAMFAAANDASLRLLELDCVMVRDPPASS